MLAYFDEAVFKIDYMFLLLCKLYNVVASFLLIRFPHGMTCAVLAQALSAALAVYGIHGKSSLYWFHSLVLVMLAGFGGGLVGPLFSGRPSVLVSNDITIPFVIVCWYLVFHIPGFSTIANWTPIKVFWTVFVGLFRTHAAAGQINATLAVLTPGVYYPTPLVGPIFIGTIMASIGAFLPFNKGLAPIEKSMPYGMQAAFVTSTFYHLMVNDKLGCLGCGLRRVVGTFTRDQALTFIAGFHLYHLFGQMFFDKDVNLMSPVHKLLYMVFNVKGPIMSKAEIEKPHVGWMIDKRNTLASIMVYGRAVLAAIVLMAHIWLNSPNVAVTYSTPLTVGSSIGICQYASPILVFDCSPIYMYLGEHKGGYSLSVFEGYAKTYEPTLKAKWTKNLTTARKGSTATLSVQPSGVFELKDEDTLLWSSKDAPCGSVPVPALDPAFTASNPWVEFITFLQTPQETRLILNSATGTPTIECSSASPNHVSYNIVN